MDLGSIFIILSLTILVGIYVSRPLLDGKYKVAESSGPSLDQELSSLLAERDRLLNSLQELDFDAALGKIPTEDYPIQRAILLQRGADILRQIDTLSTSDAAARSLSAESRIESVLAQRRLDGAKEAENSAVQAAADPLNATVSADDEVEIMLANRRRKRQGKSAGFCHKCGGSIQKVDLFCPKCGEKVK